MYMFMVMNRPVKKDSVISRELWPGGSNSVFQRGPGRIDEPCGRRPAEIISTFNPGQTAVLSVLISPSTVICWT